MRYTQVSVCSNEEHNSSIYTFFVNLTFILTSRPHLTEEDSKQYYIIFIRVLLTQLTIEALPHDSMTTKYNSNIPNEE